MKAQFIFILLFLSFSISIYGQDNSIAGAYTVKAIKGTVEKYNRDSNSNSILFKDTLSFDFNDSDMATCSVSKNDTIRNYKAYKEGVLVINNDNTFIGYLTIDLDNQYGINSWYFPETIFKGTGKIVATDKYVILCYDKGKENDCRTYKRKGNQLIQKKGETWKVVLTKE